ncbi:iron chelate uptake ABC transporter family permease subunit [Pukyongiella litopenaei]|uniref:Iron chelate uptake ABC transporter family permease subunit n=1 Tax=Pukyongiella litopenaei TaxID=2605946 RepID=A0A2S0MU57_9RHOB|nr:iron chelate uptake ABC transporter family permease subunit [Pukyongiella litopenaei]AVO39415.1 iron chelate uptake ABC transporter family permease subunit [Pukyongiella litopenaei]
MPARRLAILGALMAAACVLYLTWGARGGDLGFVIGFRTGKLAALVTVAIAVALSTLLFQTVTGNRILTPSIMGFDALFLLIRTTLVWALGATAYAALDPGLFFLAQAAIMMAAALLLFGVMLRGGQRDLNRLVLSGVVLGIGLRSLTAFLQRMIDPNAFAVIQATSFARFNRIEQDGLLIAAVTVAISAAAIWRWHRVLDAMELGRETAIGLGVEYDRMVRRALLVVAALVSVSTALAGPMVFVGLLVVSLARVALPTHRNAVLIPGAVMVAVLLLVLGQTVFERVLSLQSTLSIAIEFFGGLVFLTLIFRRSRS